MITTQGNLVAGTSSHPGLLKLTNTGGFTATVDATNLSTNRAISLPNAAGTLALVASTAGTIAQSDVSGLTTSLSGKANSGANSDITSLSATTTINASASGTASP